MSKSEGKEKVEQEEKRGRETRGRIMRKTDTHRVAQEYGCGTPKPGL